MSWTWPPPFAAAGEVLALDVTVAGDEHPDELTAIILGDQQPIPLMGDSNSSRWIAEAAVPIDIARVDVVATATTNGATVGVLELAVPVAVDSTTIEPNMVEVEPTNAIRFEYGSEHTQLGFEIPETLVEIQTPQSLGIEPTSGDIVILDSVNRRLVVVTPDGTPVDDITLPGDGRHEELVILGDTGMAAVSEWRSRNGNVEVSVHLVDLLTGTVTVDGPVVVPSLTTNVQLVWNEPLDAIFGVVVDPATGRTGYYRLYDTARQRIDIETTPESWWEPHVLDTEDAVGIKLGETTITTQLPFGFAGIVDLSVERDGTMWWLAGTVDDADFTATGVHYYLGRTDISCQRSVVAEIELDSLSELPTRTLAPSTTGVYLTNITTNSYQLIDYELPPPCEELPAS